MDKTTDSELVQRAKAGDVPAFEILYRRYNDRIYNFARKVTDSAEDAGDVAQEAFVRAWNSLPSLRQDDTFGVWLHRITLNLSRDVLKKRGIQPAVSLDSPPAVDNDGEPLRMQIESSEPGPESRLITNEVQAAINRAIDSLSPEHRSVVALHHMSGMDVNEIAEILSVPRGTVMSRLSRAREILRRKLLPYVDGDIS